MKVTESYEHVFSPSRHTRFFVLTPTRFIRVFAFIEIRSEQNNFFKKNEESDKIQESKQNSLRGRMELDLKCNINISATI